MKKITYIFLFFAMLIVASSCDKAFVNGDLDGMWRLVKVEKDGREIFPENIYYSFQRHLVMMGDYTEEEGLPSNYYMGVFARNGNSMLMNNFYCYPGVSGESNPEELEKLYIFSNEVNFFIENLGSELLVMLSDDNIRYYFRKW